MRFQWICGVMACSFAMFFIATAWADPPGVNTVPHEQIKDSERGEAAARERSGEEAAAHSRTYRASKLAGVSVQNEQGEELGSINDLVIDLQSGRVQYAAMAVGGLFGLGERLFAVPFGQLKFEHDKDHAFFVLNISKERLDAAPGFDKSNWPNFADPAWKAKVDQHYRGLETRTGAGQDRGEVESIEVDVFEY